MKTASILPGLVLIMLAAGCSPAEVPVKTYPISGTTGLVGGSTATFDSEVSSDGNGALKMTVNQPTVIPLYETGDIDVEDNRIMYRAKIRTENVQGQVYLEMWCVFGAQEFFSRALQAPLTGTQNWTKQATPFFLKAGENPDNVRLNLVFTGQGTAWIDEIELTKLDR